MTEAQFQNKRCKWIKYSDAPFELDSLSILPGSIIIDASQDSTISIHYDININKALISASSSFDSVKVCYTVLPYNLSQKSFKRSIDTYDSSASYYREDLFTPIIRSEREELFSTPGLNKTGNLSRGISFGNNQNVFVNSVLNLQMEGKLTDDIRLTAVISDQNIPFQPEGNTQQIQEFDKVYLQLQSQKGFIIAGDVVMQNKPSNFLKYYKNVQGGQAEIYLNKDSSVSSVTSVGAAISKGKFASKTLAQVEGMQGPYRLTGPNNEKFIVILSNSEKVYLDGKLLTRGFDYDYVIDYNQAEITFTTNVVITKFSRIRVDFEYSERTFSRNIFNASHYQNVGKANFFFNYYSEKDNRNNPLTINLSDEDKTYLSEIGDDLSRAYISAYDSVGYQIDKVLYKKEIVGGEEVFIYSTNKDSAYYEVRFSDVGVGNGDYIISTNALNARVYEYVGKGQGNYLPVQIIPTPKKKQMITLGAGYALSKNDHVFAELAISESDSNLYSSIDGYNDKGKAFKAGYLNKGRDFNLLKGYKWTGSIDFEFNEKNFSFIDRYREVDFDRDWSANSQVSADDNIFNASVGLIDQKKNNISYRFSRRIKGSDVNGFQHTVNLSQRVSRLQLIMNGMLSENKGDTSSSEWKRLMVNTSYHSKYLVPGVIYSFDKNAVLNRYGKIQASAMNFDELRFYLKSNDTLKVQFSGDYSIREDKEAYLGELQPNSKAQTVNITGNSRLGDNHNILSTITYRYIQNDIGPTRSANEETVLARADWNADLFKRHVRSELTITSGTGQELKRQYIFIQVPVGSGTHVWKDFNGDSIQQLNEFVEKVFNEPSGEYIKTFVPTDQYIKAYTNSFNYRVDITAPRSWRNSTRKSKIFVSKFSNVSSWTINKRLTDSDLLSRFTPVKGNIADSNLLATDQSLRSTLFFNRSNPQYGMDLSYLSSDAKSVLTQGFESRSRSDLKYNLRINIKSVLSVRLLTARNINASNSDFLPSRNFRIRSLDATPEVAYQPKNNLRFTFNVSYVTKQNIHETGNSEQVDLYKAGMEVKVNKLSKRNITANFKYINIKADLKTTALGSPIGYEMLEALQPGNNYTWNVIWQERLTNGLQLSFNYEGRKSKGTDMVHIGRMQVSALF
ncbi:MAG TPA: hypothetical protein VIK89_01805 [Cytophagaceae bacterium]